MSDKRTMMVMTMVMAKLQAEGKDVSSLSPEEIKSLIDQAIADLILAENAVEAQP